MTYTLYDFIGNIGILLILGAYWALQTERVNARSRGYNIANALGAAAILVSLLFKFNLSAFLIELAWLAISLYGLFKAHKITVGDNS